MSFRGIKQGLIMLINNRPNIIAIGSFIWNIKLISIAFHNTIRSKARGEAENPKTSKQNLTN